MKRAKYKNYSLFCSYKTCFSMKVYKTTKGFVIYHDGNYYLSRHTDWDIFINREPLYFSLQREIQKLEPDYDYKEYINLHIQAPIQSQEVWGINDEPSQAERPYMYFKGAGERIVGTKQKIRIRRDSKRSITIPKLTLFINSSGKIAAYTIGNDITAKDILDENPLYLLQAKSYNQCGAVGPCIYVPDEPLSPETKLKLEIYRAEKPVYVQNATLSTIKRSYADLACYLLKDTTFQAGCFLMLGLHTASNEAFALPLQSGDEIRISIDAIGTLVNEVM